MLGIIIYVFRVKNTKNQILKVEVRGAAYSTRSTKPHANSHLVCVLTGQEDSSGCGACRMATVYRTLNLPEQGT